MVDMRKTVMTTYPKSICAALVAAAASVAPDRSSRNET